MDEVEKNEKIDELIALLRSQGCDDARSLVERALAEGYKHGWSDGVKLAREMIEQETRKRNVGSAMDKAIGGMLRRRQTSRGTWTYRGFWRGDVVEWNGERACVVGYSGDDLIVSRSDGDAMTVRSEELVMIQAVDDSSLELVL
jgi:hypothetical protein